MGKDVLLESHMGPTRPANEQGLRFRSSLDRNPPARKAGPPSHKTSGKATSPPKREERPQFAEKQIENLLDQQEEILASHEAKIEKVTELIFSLLGEKELIQSKLDSAYAEFGFGDRVEDPQTLSEKIFNTLLSDSLRREAEIDAALVSNLNIIADRGYGIVSLSSQIEEVEMLLDLVGYEVQVQ